MLIYLDMCCLKRPFDVQSQPRVRVESEAVLGLLAQEGEKIQFVRSAALGLENSINPVKERAAKVGVWLSGQRTTQLDENVLATRLKQLIDLGLRNLDALHVATAEHANADVLATCDDKLLAFGKRHAKQLRIRVVSVIELAEELLP